MSDKRRLIRPWMAISTLIALLITSNLYWMYQMYDRASLLGDKLSVIRWCETGREDLFNILEVALEKDVKSMTPETILSTFPKTIDKRKPDGIIYVGSIAFQIQDGMISEIKDEHIYKSIKIR